MISRRIKATATLSEKKRVTITTMNNLRRRRRRQKNQLRDFSVELSSSCFYFLFLLLVVGVGVGVGVVQALVVPPVVTNRIANHHQRIATSTPEKLLTSKISGADSFITTTIKSLSSSSSCSFQLYAMTQEEEEEQALKKDDRRTRRIDEILYPGKNYNDENTVASAEGSSSGITQAVFSEENTDDAYSKTTSVHSLESSLRKEQEKSSTLAVKLAYAEQVIVEQKKRLDNKRESLAVKDEVVRKTQRQLKELEQKLDLQQQQQLQQQKELQVQAALYAAVNKNSSHQQQSEQSQQIRQQQGGRPDNNTPQARQQQQRPSTARSPDGVPSWQYPPITSSERQYPLLSYWSLHPTRGEVTGSITCHPSIPDGTTIVTSRLSNPSLYKAGPGVFVFDKPGPATVVTTQSGSKYQLGEQKNQPQQQHQQSSSTSGAGTSLRQPQRPTTLSLSQQQQQSPQPPQKKKELHHWNTLYPNLEHKLTGQSISNGYGTKYLLAGTPRGKPSGRSIIIMAYKADQQSRPIDTDTVYIVKLSTHKDKLKREYQNYCRIQDGLNNESINPRDNNAGGGWMTSWMNGGGTTAGQQQQNQQNSNSNNKDQPFVKCYDFLPVCEGSISYAQHSALLLEKGYEDVRDYVFQLQQAQRQKAIQANTRRGRQAQAEQVQTEISEGMVAGKMKPHLVQASLFAAAKGLETLHTKGRLVYTDLKAENLILMSKQQFGDNADVCSIKGIDLESCIPRGGNPLDYTPEASPPEFAKMHNRGKAYEFVLEYNYDVWSFGMLAYELATGSAYFKGKTPEQIMILLGDPSFIPPLSSNINSGDINLTDEIGNNCKDQHLYILIRSCLQVEPKYRITVPQIVNHSYFKQNLSPSAQSSQSQSSQQQQQQQQQQPSSQRGSGTLW